MFTIMAGHLPGRSLPRETPPVPPDARHHGPGRRVGCRGRVVCAPARCSDLADPGQERDVAARSRALAARLHLSGPACTPVGKTSQKAHVNRVMPDLEVDDPDAP